MKVYTFNDFTISTDNETIMTDNQIWISLFNTTVPIIFKELALAEINRYIAEHKKLTFDQTDELIGVLQIYITKSKPLEEKFNLLVFIYNENEGFQKDCLIKRPLLLHEEYFNDFRKLVMSELKKMIFEMGE